MLTTVLVLVVFNTLIAHLLLYRTKRIIADADDFANALVQVTNFQTSKLTTLSDDVHSALDAMLTVDASTASSDIAA